MSGMGRRGRGGGAGERVGEARAAPAGRRPGEVVQRDAEVEGGVGKRDREESAAATARERTAREGRWEALVRGRGGAAEEPSGRRRGGGTVEGEWGEGPDGRAWWKEGRNIESALRCIESVMTNQKKVLLFSNRDREEIQINGRKEA